MRVLTRFETEHGPRTVVATVANAIGAGTLMHAALSAGHEVDVQASGPAVRFARKPDGKLCTVRMEAMQNYPLQAAE